MLATATLFRLDLTDCSLARLATLLDDGERAQAARYRFAIDRERFVARRGQLRLFLAELTGSTPSALRYAAGAHGKPILVGHDDLHFNTSHAGAMGLCVVSRDGPMGCDIARDEATLSDLAIAQRFFSPAEHACLRSLPSADRQRAFIRIWTRKEAIVKAIGQGLQYPLDLFDAAAPGAQHVHVIEQGEWLVEPIPVGEGYVAAVAARASAVRIGVAPAVYFPDKPASRFAPFGEPQPVQASQPALAA